MSEKRLKVYAVHLLDDYSGSPRVLTDALNCLSGSDIECVVLTSQHDGFLSDSDFTKKIIPYGRFDKKWVLLVAYLLSQFICCLVLICLLLIDKLRQRKIVLLVNTMLPFGAFIAAKLMGVHCIAYVHETYISPPTFKKFLRFFIEYCASEVIFVSKYLAEAEEFELPKSTILYNGLRKDLKFSSRFSKKTRFERRSILFCGSLKNYKGLDKFILLAQSMPDFNFVAAINCFVEDLNFMCGEIPKNLQLLPRPKNLSDLYQVSFLVINLSDPELCVETFGLSILEGMAAGAPVIAPPVGGPVELVGNAGLLVHPSNIAEISAFIGCLAEDFELWCDYSRKALLRAEMFSAEKFEENLLRLFLVCNSSLEGES